jgi:hypothetical protein
MVHPPRIVAPDRGERPDAARLERPPSPAPARETRQP